MDNYTIYKISSIDTNIIDTYIGLTKNYIKAISHHKCYYNRVYNNVKLYKFMRNNGSVDNFIFTIIEELPNVYKFYANEKKQHHIDVLKPSLNIRLLSIIN